MSTERVRRAAPRKPTGELTLTRAQVAELCGAVNPHATDRLVAQHPDFPRPFYPFPKSPRWLRSAVEAWIRKQHRAAQVSREALLAVPTEAGSHRPTAAQHRPRLLRPVAAQESALAQENAQ